MHATFDELLNLRIQSEDSPLSAHVRACAECRNLLAQLQARTEALRRLPAKGPAPERWDAIQRALLAPPVADHAAARSRAGDERQLRPGWLLPAASAAAVVLAVVVVLQQRDEIRETGQSVGQTVESAGPDASGTTPHEATPSETTPVVQAQNAARLIQESQRLENLLAAYTEEPRLTRASTELTVAELEDRIQWIDYRLNLAAERGVDPYQSQRLWRERVDLLNSLVAVRYAQARTTAF